MRGETAHKEEERKKNKQQLTKTFFFISFVFSFITTVYNNIIQCVLLVPGSTRQPTTVAFPSPASKRIAKSKNIQAHLPACTNKLQLCVLILAEYITHLNRHRVERHHV